MMNILTQSEGMLKKFFFLGRLQGVEGAIRPRMNDLAVPLGMAHAAGGLSAEEGAAARVLRVG